jgi:hypothetical protein
MPKKNDSQHQVVAPTIPVQLDRERHLFYSFDALARIEELLDVSVLSQPLNSYLTKSVTNMATVLWAGLLHEDDTLDTEDPQDGIKQVRRSMAVRDGIAYIKAINQAFEMSSPETDAEGANADSPLPQDATPTGSISGPSPKSTSG